jgi:hypothetical protein
MNKLDNSKLTNDAKFLISSMYAEYIKRRREQIRKSQARNFYSIDYLKTHIMPEWSDEDILDTCFELRKHGYVEGALADNSFYTLYITTEAISELETDFKDTIDTVLEYAAKIKNAIPFL